MNSTFIAVTGKGGVGKTTLSALLARGLIKRGKCPVLAIDADPNSCLDAALGVTVTGTVGRAREDTRSDVSEGTISGISKTELLQMRVNESLVESDGFDLIAMGRPEGAGCYCYANNVLRDVITKLAKSYPFVVLDNEAGLENLSRRIVSGVDVLILVSDASNAGLKTLVRLHELALEMGTSYKKLLLVVNRLRNGVLPDTIHEIVGATGADGVIGLPDDAELAAFAEEGKNLLSLPDDNPVIMKVDEIINGL